MKRIIDYLKLALFAFVVSASVISCSNDEFFGFDDDNYINSNDTQDYFDNHKININEIISSHEFEAYILSKMKFSSIFINIDTANSIYVDSLNMYRIDFGQQLDTIRYYHTLLTNRFIEYDNIPLKMKTGMSIIVLDKLSKQLSDTTNSNFYRKIGRRKKKDPESIAHQYYPNGRTVGHYTYSPFLFFSDAQDACIQYSHQYAKESGGFVFEDYSSLFITDDRATLTTYNLPALNFIYGTPQFGYHYHPYSDHLSHEDSLAIKELGFNIYIIHDDYFLYPH